MGLSLNQLQSLGAAAPAPAPTAAPAAPASGYAPFMPQTSGVASSGPSTSGLIAGAMSPASAPAAAPAPAIAPAPAPIVAAPSPTPAPAPVAVTPGITAVPSIGTNQTALATTPNAWNVTPDQTVEGRIRSIIDANNPIIAQARSQALEGMNARGLVNSSMATTAADSAAYAAAAPIAQADAATAAKAASYNADQGNKFTLNNQDALNKQVLEGMSTGEQTLVQSNSQAASAFNGALQAINQINQNDKMDASSKTQAIAQIQNVLKTQLNTLQATSSIGVSGQLDFSNWNGFDASGKYVGFDPTGNTAGTAPPAVAPAPSAPEVGTGYQS